MNADWKRKILTQKNPLFDLSNSTTLHLIVTYFIILSISLQCHPVFPRYQPSIISDTLYISTLYFYTYSTLRHIQYQSSFLHPFCSLLAHTHNNLSSFLNNSCYYKTPLCLMQPVLASLEGSKCHPNGYECIEIASSLIHLCRSKVLGCQLISWHLLQKGFW